MRPPDPLYKCYVCYFRRFDRVTNNTHNTTPQRMRARDLLDYQPDTRPLRPAADMITAVS
jgi:hypothetical protein